MVPTPQELSPPKDIPSMDAERVVISGMSGAFPQADSIKELSDILYNKVDPMTETDRWDNHHPEIRSRIGQFKDLTKFDAQFFKVHYRTAQKMEPVARIVLEQAFQAIYDAGICPDELSGRKVSVYLGQTISEMDSFCIFDIRTAGGGQIIGSSKAMMANRISYALNLKGPSLYVSNGCSETLLAMKLGIRDIQQGVSEAAIVCGVNNLLKPNVGIQYSRILKCCRDGKTRSFDENADGLSQSESVAVFFLQKAKHAKRIYAEIVALDISYEGILMEKYAFQRDPMEFYKYLENFYKDSPVPPEAVEYVEALGSAQSEADKMELEVFDKIFCKNRNKPLPVGSVASNIGWAEAAAAANSIVKVLLGYHTGKLAGNLHCEKPRQDVAALREDRLRILSDHLDFARSYAAVNNLSISGCNGHLILKGYEKNKNPSRYQSSLPRLVTLTGRIDTSVTKIIEDLKSRPIDPEEIALLHGINSKNISGHIGKGYVILDTNKEGKTVSLSEKTVHFDKSKRPLWFVYSGMGSQWAGMGAQLMRIPVFAGAIDRCRKVLEPKGVDIVHIITSPDKKIFDNILNSFVGIAAIQIGLTDVLKSIGIVPDMIIGHSVGELGCAYADGCFTAEEMILSAYSRGLVSVQTPFIRGSMAAVGLGFEKIVNLLPPEIFVACHNSNESSTISGPADKMQAFVEELTAKGIFAKEVPCSNIAYHSKYIADAGPGLLKYLTEVIKDPKPRSSRWVSTSVPQDRWNEPAAELSSAEYHTNNLLNPVLFEESSQLIPKDAVLVEIAPHGLLQAILKRSLPESCVKIALTRRGHPDNALMVLEAIGKLYTEGYYSSLESLYPKVEFPVSTGTPMLSHLIEWSHNENWALIDYRDLDHKRASSCNYIVSIFDNEHKYLRGNLVGGKVLYPIAAVLVDIWDTLAMWLNKPKRSIPVEFTDIYLYSQLPIHEQKSLKITVSIQQGCGNFEVMNGNIKVATGKVLPIIGEHSLPIFALSVPSQENLELTSDDIYNLFAEKDFHYEGGFRSLSKANTSLTEADVIWNQDWVTFLDGVLQLHTLNQPHDYISQPSYIGSVTIDYRLQGDNVETVNNVTSARAHVLENEYTIIRCGGVLIKRLKYSNLAYFEKEKVLLKSISNINIASRFENKAQETLDVVSLRSSRLGDMNSLEWTMFPESSGPGIAVNVKFAAINDIDAKIATGVIPQRETYNYGMDFSGLTDRGTRVMGLVNGGAVSSRVKVQPELLWPVPDHWTLEDAATVPSAYALAFYCLVLKTKLFPDMSILVHGGCGALGQAVISLALALGNEVFTTVSSSEKKNFLLKLYPDLKEDHVGYSRNQSFVDMVRCLTHQRGVDLIINCLKGELRKASLNCAGKLSIALDLAPIPNKEKYSLGMSYLDLDRNYVAVDFSSIFKSKNIDEMKMIHQLVSDGIRAGYVRPLTRMTYAPEQTVRAFRLLADSNHRGRVLLKMNDANYLAQCRFTCSPGGSQLVVCAGALGTQWVDRLVRRGARHIVLHAPEGIKNLSLKIQSWEKLGVKIQISSLDLTKVDNVDNLISEIENVAPLEGIYVIASNVDEENKSQLKSVMVNLDNSTRKSSPSLKYFSVVSAGNTIGLITCDKRIRASLPATFLDISKLSNDGAIPWRSAVDAMERALVSTQPAVAAHLKTEPKLSLLHQIAKAAEIDVPKDYTNYTTLKDLGLTPERVSLVLAFLNDVHNLSLNEELIVNLTVKEINELEESLYGKVFADQKGLSKLLLNIGTDDLANTQTIPKRTLVCSSTDMYETGQKYLFILPGLESNDARFNTLCERLKIQAMVLNNIFNTDGSNTETIDEIVNRLAKYLLEVLLLKETKPYFYLLGYETSVIIALELAAALEKEGLTGTVFCLGGAPEDIKVNLNSITKEFSSEEDFETALLVHMSTALANNVETLEDELKKVNTWADKLKTTKKVVQGRTIATIQYTIGMIEHVYNTFKLATSVVAERKNLQSKVVLLRAGDVPPITERQLQAYSKQPLSIHNLSTPLAHVAQDLRISAIINSHLLPDIHEDFEKGNRCDLYNY